MRSLIRNVYFHGQIPRGFRRLMLGRLTTRVGAGLLGLFAPIFLFSLFGFNLYKVLGFYAIGFAGYLFLVPIGIKLMNWQSLKKSMMVGISALIMYWFSFLLVNNGFNAVILIAALIFLVSFRCFFWVPFHTDFAKFTNRRNRAKQLSIFFVISSLIDVIMPIGAGFIIAHSGFNIIFVLAMLIYGLSMLFFAKLPRVHEKFTWNYIQTWQEFISQKRRKIVAAYMADGAESVIGVIIWPIFIWQLLNGDFFQVGALSAFIIGVSIILQLLVGRFADQINKNKMLHIGSIFYSLGWVAKMFILTAFQIFIVSTYHSFARIFLRTPFDTINYELAADQGHFVDEYTVIHEMAVALGAIIMLLSAMVIFSFFGLPWTFILAAFAVLFFNLLHTGQLANDE